MFDELAKIERQNSRSIGGGRDPTGPGCLDDRWIDPLYWVAAHDDDDWQPKRKKMAHAFVSNNHSTIKINKSIRSIRYIHPSTPQPPNQKKKSPDEKQHKWR